MAELIASAAWAQRELLSAPPPCDAERAEAVWKATLEEAGPGKEWLRGPYTPEELRKELGPRWLGARRFGIVQSGKLRLIDDFSEFHQNAATGLPEKLAAGELDEVVGLAKAWVRVVRPDRTVEVSLSTGEEMRGVLHPTWSYEEAVDLVGRTIDLKSAYKRMAIKPAHQFAAVIAVCSVEERRWTLWIPRAMPFGASTAVHGFSRVALVLRQIAVRGLGLVVTNYLDDYPLLESRVLGESASSSVLELLQILGWQVSQDPKKVRPFDKDMAVLGVVLGLEGLAKGANLTLTNKPERVEDILQMVARVKSDNQLSPALAATLRGRLLYAEQQCVGRCGIMATRALGVRAQEPGGRVELTPQLRRALEWVEAFLADTRPREVCTGPQPPPVVIFTDGACKGEGFKDVTVGGVMFAPSGRCEAFEMRVPEQVARRWPSGKAGQSIGQAELYPVAVAKATWRQYIEGRQVIYFIDNDSARFALIRHYSPHEASADIIWQAAAMDIEARSSSWYARVASASNVADAPSRLRIEEVVRAFGAEKVETVIPTVLGWAEEVGQ